MTIKLPEGNGFLCAVSGGADSTALLLLLCKKREENPGIELVCAHYNHGLREAANKDEEHVRALCGRLGVEFICERGDAAKEAARLKKGIEETARAMRYDFLERARKTAGLDWIATAHTADDNAETVLLNLTRGAGLRGICGIPPQRGYVVRPLIEFTREEILGIVSDTPVCEDESNSDLAFRRNYMRHEVIPLLKKCNPSFINAVSRMTGLLSEDEAYLYSLAQAEWEQYGRFCGGCASFPAKRLIVLPSPVAARLCRLMTVRFNAMPPELPHIEAMLDIAEGGNGRQTDLPGKLTAAKLKNNLLVMPKTGC